MTKNNNVLDWTPIMLISIQKQFALLTFCFIFFRRLSTKFSFLLRQENLSLYSNWCML